MTLTEKQLKGRKSNKVGVIDQCKDALIANLANLPLTSGFSTVIQVELVNGILPVSSRQHAEHLSLWLNRRYEERMVQNTLLSYIVTMRKSGPSTMKLSLEVVEHNVTPYSVVMARSMLNKAATLMQDSDKMRTFGMALVDVCWRRDCGERRQPKYVTGVGFIRQRFWVPAFAYLKLMTYDEVIAFFEKLVGKTNCALLSSDTLDTIKTLEAQRDFAI
jgi:hypothetical protein